MSVKTDIKYNDAVIDSLTSSGSIEYATANKYLEHTLSIEFTGTEDATVTANKILSGYTAYGADGNKATGTITTWSGEMLPNCLHFIANEAGSTISIAVVGTPTLNQNFQFSTDCETWQEFIPSVTTITLTNIGDKVYFKGDNPNGISVSTSMYYKFIMTGNISAGGNIMSLIDNGTCAATAIPNEFCFGFLFLHCSALVKAPLLPAVELVSKCYYGMFLNNGITAAPELPATTLASHCYDAMFQGCAALLTSPILSATNLAEYCYGYMFRNCTSLTTVPKLPATSLYYNCYSYMFSGCTSLQVNDSPVAGVADHAWTIPDTDPVIVAGGGDYVFTNCAGVRSSDGMYINVGSQKTYYTQNPPV